MDNTDKLSIINSGKILKVCGYRKPGYNSIYYFKVSSIDGYSIYQELGTRNEGYTRIYVSLEIIVNGIVHEITVFSKQYLNNEEDKKLDTLAMEKNNEVMRNAQETLTQLLG